MPHRNTIRPLARLVLAPIFALIGFTLIASILLSPASVLPPISPSASNVGVPPPTPTLTPLAILPSPSVLSSPSLSSVPSPSSPSPSPSPTPTIDTLIRLEVPTRVVVAHLGIDLPIITPNPNETFPMCNVAEIDARYGLIGSGGVTFLYGHARTGMFWPLLRETRSTGGKSLIGLEVLLYTDANVLYHYTIAAVYPNVRDWSISDNTAFESLFLQTSEDTNPNGPKLLVMALPVGDPTPVSSAVAQPKAVPLVCH